MAGPALNGSALMGALSAWRKAASVRAPWAVRAARARFIESRSTASRFSGESRSGPSSRMKPASDAEACGREGALARGGGATISGLVFGSAACGLAWIFDLAGDFDLDEGLA